jgi:hypothetical protein
LQQQQQSISNATTISSLYLCQTFDGNILNAVHHNASTATNSSEFYEYCTATSKLVPYVSGSAEIMDVDIQGWCRPNDVYDTDDATLIKYCADIKNSSKYSFYEYVVPNMTMIDNLRLPNDKGGDSSTPAAVCSFSSFLSSFFTLKPPEAGTLASTSNEGDASLPLFSIFGNNSPTDNKIAATYLQGVLRDVLVQQQQQPL